MTKVSESAHFLMDISVSEINFEDFVKSKFDQTLRVSFSIEKYFTLSF